MNNKIFALGVILSMLLAMAAVPASAAVVQSGTCGANGDNLTWVFDDTNTLTISGTGDMENYIAGMGDPWTAIKGVITTIIIENGVTSIGNMAFDHCTSLRTIVLSDTLTRIGDNGIDNTPITSIAIPVSVTSIGMGAFYGCYNLSNVYYEGTEAEWSNVSIGEYARFHVPTHYNCILSKTMTAPTNYNGGTKTLLSDGVLDISENLYYRNGYVNASEGYIKSGDKKITGSNVHFASDGKIRLDAGDTAKIVEDDGNGTSTQGFIAGLTNPNATVTVTLVADGTVDEVDCTGKTISEEFDFSGYEIEGLVNFGFAMINIPNTLSLTIQSIE